MKNKKSKNKILKYIFSLTIGLSSVVLIPTINQFKNNSLNIVNNSLIETLNNESELNNNDQANFSNTLNKVSTIKTKNEQVDYEVEPIHISGKDNLVWLVFGEGFTANDQNSYVDYVKNSFSKIMNFDIYKDFMQFINVYAVKTISKTNWTGDDSIDNTIFGLRSSGNVNYSPRLGSKGQDCLNSLRKQLLNNYLDDGAQIIESSILVKSPKGEKFRSINWGGDYSLVSIDTNNTALWNVILHESGHGIGKLTDEYPGGVPGKNNAVSTVEDANASWSEFLGYKYKIPNSNTTIEVKTNLVSGGNYISYDPEATSGHNCFMYSTSGGHMCAVCKYYFFDQLNQQLNNYFDFFALDPYVLYNLATNSLTVKTVCKNYTNKNKTIRIELISQKDPSKTYSKDFVLAPNSGPKQIQINATEKTLGTNNLTWRLVDVETGKLIKSSSQSDYFNLTFNFKDENGKTILLDNVNSNITIKLIKGSDYTLELPRLDGYVFTSNTSLQFNNINANQTIDLVFRKLPSKQIKLILKYQNETVIKERLVNVYENSSFTRTSDDFIINNGVGFTCSFKNDNETLSYNEINDNNNTISYYVTEFGPEIRFIAKHYYRVGDPHPAGTTGSYIWQVTNIYGRDSLEGAVYPNSNVDWNTPGEYKVSIKFDVTFTNYENNSYIHRNRERTETITILPANATLPPEPENPNPPIVVPPIDPTPPVDPDKPIDPTPPVDPDKPIDPTPPVDPDKPIDPTPPVDPDQPITPPSPADNPEVVNSINIINENKVANANNYQQIIEVSNKFNSWNQEEKDYLLQQCNISLASFEQLVLDARNIEKNNLINSNSNNSSNMTLILSTVIPIVAVISIVGIIVFIIFKKKRRFNIKH